MPAELRRELDYRVPPASFVAILAERLREDPSWEYCHAVSARGRELVAVPLTLADLAERALAAAAMLDEAGAKSGDRVVISLADPHAFLAWIFAAFIRGMSAVPVPTAGEMGAPAAFVDRLRGVCADCHPSVIVVESRARWNKVAARLEHDAAVIENPVASPRPPASRCSAEELAAALEDQPLARAAVLQYTSGSTGDPKGVVLSHGNLVANCQASGQVAGFGPSDRMVSWLPLHHDMGLIGGLLVCLLWRMQTFILSPITFVSRPVNWLRAIQRFGGTLSVGPSFGYNLCLRKIPDEQLVGLDLSTWRLAFVGAETVPAEMLRAFAERYAKYGFHAGALFPVYGLAEATLAVAFPDPGDLPSSELVDRERLAREGRAVVTTEAERAVSFTSLGTAVAGHVIGVRSTDTGEPCEEREVGEVVVAGPSVSVRYYSDPSDSQRELLRTGDLGYIAGGKLFVVDRIKDIVIIAGQNYATADIESACSDVVGIRRGRVAAFSTSNAGEATESLCLIAEINPDTWRSPAELRAELSLRVLQRIGVAPRAVLISPPRTLEKTTSGKLRRSSARDRYLARELPTIDGRFGLWLCKARHQLRRLVLLRYASKLGGDRA